MARRYSLFRPTPIELAQSAARLAGFTGEELAAQRGHAARQALPAKYRTRNKLTDPEWPAPDDLATWHAIGAHDALAFTLPRVKVSDHPSALAYYAGYTPTLGAFMMPDQVPNPESPLLLSPAYEAANQEHLDVKALGAHLVNGDASAMNEKQQADLLVALAKSVGVSPLIRPFMIVDGSVYPTAICASAVRIAGGLECDPGAVESIEVLGVKMIQCVAECADPASGRSESAKAYVPWLTEHITEWGTSASGKKYPKTKEWMEPTPAEVCDKIMKVETKAVRRATFKFAATGTSAVEDLPASTTNQKMWVEQVEEPASDETQATPVEPDPPGAP